MHFFRLRLVAALLIGITLISVASTYFDVLARNHALRLDLSRRTQWFGAGLQPQLELQLAHGAPDQLGAALRDLRQSEDQPALAVFDPAGHLLASTGNIHPLRSVSDLSSGLLKKPLKEGKEASTFLRVFDDVPPGSSDSPTRRLWYEEAIPLHDDKVTIGALVLVANADYIRAENFAEWRRSFLRIAAMVIVIVGVTLAMVRWFLLMPVTRAAEWLRRIRQGKARIDDGNKEFAYLAPLAKEVTSMAENLAQARAAAQAEARLRDSGENIWTANRLAVHVRERLGNGRLFVVSNREPYMHQRRGREIECVVPPSGLVTAIEPILQACDGTWVAHGSGSGDAAFVDAHDRLRVPPEDPRYTLRRVWLSQEEEAGYYEGFSNEGLWPLCHIAHTRPTFRASDWGHYQRVNARFAEVLIEEMKGVENPVVFVQDYHFALLPALIKQARPDARVGIFWHIPWPNAEAFGICPWQSELLTGLLGADVIGFHIQSHCNNFLSTVDRALEARTDWERFSIRRNGHQSIVRPFPISVAWDEHLAGEPEADTPEPRTPYAADDHYRRNGISLVTAHARTGNGALHRELGIEGQQLVLGVDRMDYTKGIVERLLAVETLLEHYPRYCENITFVQIAAPTRSRIPAYTRLREQLEETVNRINLRFQTPRWKPVILIERQCSHTEVKRYYAEADVCLVTSLHDGMNLVAKEYLAARRDNDGVLVLSRFAGAAQELRDALLVNPYDIEQVAEAIRTGLEMSPGEATLRMERMRTHVKEHNVYRWAANVLTDICNVRLDHETQGYAEPRSGKMLA